MGTAVNNDTIYRFLMLQSLIGSSSSPFGAFGLQGGTSATSIGDQLSGFSKFIQGLSSIPTGDGTLSKETFEAEMEYCDKLEVSSPTVAKRRRAWFQKMWREQQSKPRKSGSGSSGASGSGSSGSGAPGSSSGNGISREDAIGLFQQMMLTYNNMMQTLLTLLKQQS